MSSRAHFQSTASLWPATKALPVPLPRAASTRSHDAAAVAFDRMAEVMAFKSTILEPMPRPEATRTDDRSAAATRAFFDHAAMRMTPSPLLAAPPPPSGGCGAVFGAIASDPVPYNLLPHEKGASLAQTHAKISLDKAFRRAEAFAMNHVIPLSDSHGRTFGTACWLKPDLLIMSGHVADRVSPLYVGGLRLYGERRRLGDVILFRPTSIRGPETQAPLAADRPMAGDPLFLVYDNGRSPVINQATALSSAAGYGLQAISHVAGEGGASGGIILNQKGEIVSLHLGRMRDETSLRLQIPIHEIFGQEAFVFGDCWYDDTSSPRYGDFAWAGGEIDGVPEIGLRELKAELEELGCRFSHSGGDHDIWTNGERTFSVPRHGEIKEGTAFAIRKQAKDLSEPLHAAAAVVAEAARVVPKPKGVCKKLKR